MRRRLPNLATCLSVALAAAALAVWVRSLSVTEAWCFVPEPLPKPKGDWNPESRGWERWRLVASMDGRFVYASVDERLILGQPGRSAFVGYHHSNFMPPEWDRNPVGDGRIVRVVRVPWLAFAVAGLALPAVRLSLYRRRPRGPTFEVATAA